MQRIGVSIFPPTFLFSKFRKSLWVGCAALLLGVASCAPATTTPGDGQESDCSAITCSGHGLCVNNGGVLECACDEGYSPSGLNCLPLDGGGDDGGDFDPGDSDPGDSDPGDSDPGDSDPGDGGCVPTSHDSSACVDGDLYWFDSCGDQEELAQSCAGLGCSAGFCNTPAPGTPCGPDYGTDLTLIEGMDTTQQVVSAKPAKGESVLDEAYSTCITRATDHTTEGVQPGGGTSNLMRNDYARRNAFNADSSRFFVYARGGYWHYYDTETMTRQDYLPVTGDGEPHWHPTDPDVLYYLPNNGGMVMYEHNIATDSTTTVADFRDVTSINGDSGVNDIRDIWADAARIWTRSEGSPSADGRYWALQVDTSGFAGIGMLVYDLQTNSIVGTYDFAANGYGRPNNVSMSPSGDYIVAAGFGTGSGCSGSTLGTFADPCGVMAWNRDFSAGIGLSKQAEHFDLAFDADGNDVLVIGNFTSGFVEMVSLDTGAVTHLWGLYISGNKTSVHISGTSYAKPGWALVSTYAGNGVGHWYNDKIMAVELKADGRILNIAHTHNDQDDYWSEPQACVNKDFTRILFNSNWWNTGSEDVDAYMIALPAGVLD